MNDARALRAAQAGLDSAYWKYRGNWLWSWQIIDWMLRSRGVR
jgi:hypothetical protein